MIIFVDIDETICAHPHTGPSTEGDYAAATPIKENIAKINLLHKKGHTVIYWTARGSSTSIDWTDLTKRQLKDWGAQYDELRLDKPYYNLFICDKAISSEAFFKSNLL